MIWIFVGILCIDQVVSLNYDKLGSQARIKSTLSFEPKPCVQITSYENVWFAYEEEIVLKRRKLVLEASSTSSNDESFDRSMPSTFEFSGRHKKEMIAIDTCTEDYCDLLYENDSRGERGECGSLHFA